MIGHLEHGCRGEEVEPDGDDVGNHPLFDDGFDSPFRIEQEEALGRHVGHGGIAADVVARYGVERPGGDVRLNEVVGILDGEIAV